MKRIYIFSGLGADHRVFKYIDFEGFEPVFIRWIPPEYNETIEHYATRLLVQITDECPAVLGISFGGIMAVEIAKQIKTEKVLLIATVQTRQELPYMFKIAGIMGLHKIVPARLLKHPGAITNWFFGTESRRDKDLLAEIMRDTDPVFLKWAIEKVVSWKNTIRPSNLRHIHGTRDKLFPARYVHCDIKVDAGHFLTVNRPIELSALIRKEME